MPFLILNVSGLKIKLDLKNRSLNCKLFLISHLKCTKQAATIQKHLVSAFIKWIPFQK